MTEHVRRVWRAHETRLFEAIRQDTRESIEKQAKGKVLIRYNSGQKARLAKKIKLSCI